MALNFARAVRLNDYWSQRLGWARQDHYEKVLRLFRSHPRTPREFAEAVAQWQYLRRPRLVVDGIIGPNTWKIMQRDLRLSSTSSAGSNQNSSTGAAATSQQHTLDVRGHKIHFYVYVNAPNAQQKIQQLQRFFSRLPDQHLAVLYPIFVMEKKPGGRIGGGTWKPAEVRGSFTGASHVRNTGIPAADIARLAINPGKGVIGLSKDRWERPISRLVFSMFHEVGHCVDYSFRPGGLVPPGATPADFAGMQTNRCGAGNMMVRRAVEAYARYICSPSRIYHQLPPSQSQVQTNQRLIRSLRQSPAFRSVSTAWRP